MATTFPTGATAATLSGATAGVFLTLTSISVSGAAREALATSNMDTSTDMTFIPGDIQDPGEITFEGFADGSDLHTDLGRIAEVWTLIFRAAALNLKFFASGFMTSFELTGELESVWTYSGTLKFTGAITIENAPP